MKTVIALAIALAATSVLADVYVNPYSRSDGTQVEGYYRSSPNYTTRDNYSTYGNTNPYTGQQGTVRDYGRGAVENYGGSGLFNNDD